MIHSEGSSLPVPEEEIIDLVTSLPASQTCASDAGHVIEEKLSINPDAAHPIVENLIEQRSIEARTATSADEVAPGKGDPPKVPSALPYKFVRPNEKQPGK
jgi:hypothetical protein